MHQTNPNTEHIKYRILGYDDLSRIQKLYKNAKINTDQVWLTPELEGLDKSMKGPYDNAFEKPAYAEVANLAALLRSTGYRLAAVPVADVIDRDSSSVQDELIEWVRSEMLPENAPKESYIYEAYRHPDVVDHMDRVLSDRINGRHSCAEAIQLILSTYIGFLQLHYESGQLSACDCNTLSSLTSNMFALGLHVAEEEHQAQLSQIASDFIDDIFEDLRIPSTEGTGDGSDSVAEND